MQDNTLVIIAGVGLAVICLGLFVVLFVTVFRFTGRNFMSFLALLVRDSNGDKNEPSVIRTPKPDLRSIAESEDFDSALARQAVREQTPSQTTHRPYKAETASAPSTERPSDRPFDDAAPRLGSRRSNTLRRPIDRSEDTDDVFGAFPDVDDFGL